MNGHNLVGIGIIELDCQTRSKAIQIQRILYDIKIKLKNLIELLITINYVRDSNNY